MDHATRFRLLSATHFATSLLPLTVRLIPVLTEIGRLIVGFRRAELTPQVCHQFETQIGLDLPAKSVEVIWGRSLIRPSRREASVVVAQLAFKFPMQLNHACAGFDVERAVGAQIHKVPCTRGR